MAACWPFEAVDLVRARLYGRFISCGLVTVLLDPLGTATAPADGIEVFIALAPTVVPALSLHRCITLQDRAAPP